MAKRSGIAHRLIAVVIPYYQVEAGILARALEGVAAQNLAPDQAVRVYIVDDASPHPAEDELTDCAPADRLDIRVVRQPNSGPGIARNAGLDLVKADDDADFVAFLDSDDIWKPDHLKDALAALDQGYDFYCCDNSRPGSFDLFSEHVDILNGGGRKLADRSVVLDPDGPVRGFAPHALNDEVVIEYISHTSTIVIRAAIVEDIRFDGDLRNAGEDRMFWLMLALAGARIAISWRLNVVCGSGVNLFFSAHSWDAPATVERAGCELLFAEKLLRHSDLSPRRLAYAQARAARSRRAYSFLFLRMLVRLRMPPTGMLRKLLAFDPLLPLRIPPLFLGVFLSPKAERRI
ncbi:MAG: glycosyltransferase family 2 protein [Rhodobacteraceae bacterium]|nr:glycosyltransferase family 2 protein [Silicimonas sp.]RZW03859.1 MAG: glycosyltransferase family 2 protein [Paracoccaceae bacterium]